MQQPFTTLLTKCNGISYVEETIYENRFKNVEYLNKMGANIEIITDHKIKIQGPTNLTCSNVYATDLRGGASVLLAALSSKGVSNIYDVEHLLRGYENIVEKLSNVGAKIKIEEI